MERETKKIHPTEKETFPFLDATRKVLLASIGVMALAQDEIEDFVGKLIDRGEIAERDGRQLVREIVDRRKIEAKEAEDEAARRVQQFLDKLNVPTKDDINLLNEKLNLLSMKIEELKNSQK
jgi:poly(hydroxyalkanoate) granule-associated protein